jgi:hypothetical protein
MMMTVVMMAMTTLTMLTTIVVVTLSSQWCLPLFAYRACLRWLGHLHQRVS